MGKGPSVAVAGDGLVVVTFFVEFAHTTVINGNFFFTKNILATGFSIFWKMTGEFRHTRARTPITCRWEGSARDF